MATICPRFRWFRPLTQPTDILRPRICQRLVKIVKDSRTRKWKFLLRSKKLASLIHPWDNLIGTREHCVTSKLRGIVKLLLKTQIFKLGLCNNQNLNTAVQQKNVTQQNGVWPAAACRVWLGHRTRDSRVICDRDSRIMSVAKGRLIVLI